MEFCNRFRFKNVLVLIFIYFFNLNKWIINFIEDLRFFQNLFICNLIISKLEIVKFWKIFTYYFFNINRLRLPLNVDFSTLL